MSLSKQNEQAWQELLRGNPNLNTDFIRAVFDGAFYRGVLAEQKSKQALEEAA